METGRTDPAGGMNTGRFPNSVHGSGSEMKKRKTPIVAKVHDRHNNFTKYGFPSTYQEKNNNAIKNTAMYDPDRNMENENLVNKTNHL